MTPGELFEPLHVAFDFTGDACATDEEAARVPRFLSPEQDALRTPWDELGPRVWCNPPYGRQISRWFARVEKQVATGAVDLAMMLTFANTDTQYWRDHVANAPNCHAVCFLRPRVRFELPGGGGRAGAPKGSALILFHRWPRIGRWPLHSYGDWTAPNWIQSSGLGHFSPFALKRERA